MSLKSIGKPLPCSALLICLAATAARALETARVEVADGAPRIVIDGQPVRARMFWGQPGRAALSVTVRPSPISFEFTAAADSKGAGTLHLRFDEQPGTFWLDDVRIEDAESGRDLLPACDFSSQEAFQRDWLAWPPDEKNTVAAMRIAEGQGRDGSAALEVKLRAPPDGIWPDLHLYTRPNLNLVKGHRYRVSMWGRADGERKLRVALYRPGHPFILLGGPPDYLSQQTILAAAAGVNLVSFPMPLPWPKPDQQPDWSGVDAACERVLQANPRAQLLPRIGTSPPQWWRDAHADEMMAWDQPPQPRNQQKKVEDVSVASQLWRDDVRRHLVAVIEHCEAKFGPHVAGYHPCGQNTGEWFYQNTWGKALNGYAPADRRAWRAWLAKQYRDDATLRKAWNDAIATLAAAEVPTPEARRAAPTGVLCDPQAQRRLIDWAQFQQESMADCVCQLAHTVRQATRGRKLVVFFYGYVFEFGPVANAPATCGHYALRRALECPDIDILCSPISYFDRGLAQSAPAMSAAESVALAGKMWLYEDDTRTYLGTGKAPGWRDGVSTLEDTNRELLRNVAQEALRNFGTWWMDLGGTGWFNDPRMWAEMKRLAPLDQALLAVPCPFRPDVAAVIDERSMLCVASGGSIVTRPGIYEVRRPLGRMGTPYGQYLLDDLLAGRVPAKLCVLLNAWALDAGQRQQLLKAIDGRARIWCYAPGYIDGDRFSEKTGTVPICRDGPEGASHKWGLSPFSPFSAPEVMQQLTGFRLTPVELEKALAEPTAAGRRLGLEEPFGVPAKIRPLLAASDAKGDEVLATYTDGSAAVAMRQTPRGLSIFVGPPGLTSQLLRLAATRAGVHLFTHTDCNVYANGRWLALHAAADGPLEINLGRAAEVRDLLQDKPLGRGPKLQLPVRQGETRVLEIRD